MFLLQGPGGLPEALHFWQISITTVIPNNTKIAADPLTNSVISADIPNITAITADTPNNFS